MVVYHSQHEQDRLIDQHVFRGMRGGIFVDIGAHDGVSISNTLTFESHYGWTGLCVEANPSVFPKLKAARLARSLNVAIGERVGELPFYQVSGSAEMLSGLVSASKDQHLERVRREIDAAGGSLAIINVPVRRLNDVLAENELTEVHYLSIDTEGNEAEIIGTIDHDTAFVHVIDAECASRSDLSVLHEACGKRFLSAGWHHGDAFFVNRRSPFASNIGRLRRAVAIENLRRRARTWIPKHFRQR